MRTLASDVRDMARTVTMTPDGRVTIPAAALRQLGVEGETQFDISVDHDSLVLLPAVVLPREDAWAYTVEHRRLLAQAHRDSREGRVRRLGARQLARVKTK